MHNEEGIQRGKDFEEIIKHGFMNVEETVVQRLPDPTAGYIGHRNPCDFLIYHYPYVYFIECKTVHSHRLPFSNITFNQRVGMLEAVKCKGVIAGVICWFIPEDKTYFVPIQVIERMRQNNEKSLNLHNADTKDWIELTGRKKRIFYEYDLAQFIEYCTRKKLGERKYK